MSTLRLVVVSGISPSQLVMDEHGKPKLSATEEADDRMDHFNHPRYRRGIILQTLDQAEHNVVFEIPSTPASDLNDYLSVHSPGLIEFLSTAWDTWVSLGEEGQDASGALPVGVGQTPALIPSNAPLGRDRHQRPSKHVIGQMGYYCTDNCTPIFASFQEEILLDASIINVAMERALQEQVAYALPTHPGHHAAKDSFGGYCYVNHAARAARLLQSKLDAGKVAILDVDYHCGNGTASIFYQDPSVLVVSIHCDPDWDYPFHSGFADETGAEEGVGTTLHLPLPPESDWNIYHVALTVGLDRIVEDFGAQAVVVSLGLDTYEADPCTIRRAGFRLTGENYKAMGQTMREKLGDLPTLFVQEGGYRMDKVGEAAADVLVGFCMPS